MEIGAQTTMQSGPWDAPSRYHGAGIGQDHESKGELLWENWRERLLASREVRPITEYRSVTWLPVKPAVAPHSKSTTLRDDEEGGSYLGRSQPHSHHEHPNHKPVNRDSLPSRMNDAPRTTCPMIAETPGSLA
jgi:hypothetical protein